MSDSTKTPTETTAIPAGDPSQRAATTTDAPLGDGGKAALDAERTARKAAERDLKALRERLDAIDAETKSRDEADAAKRGEWEQLATKREGERDAARSEATTLKAENDQLRAAIAGVLDSEWKALPAEVRDAYLGGDDDPLAKLAFLPKGKKLAEKLAGATPVPRGAGPDPRPNGAAKPHDAAGERAARAMLRNF